MNIKDFIFSLPKNNKLTRQIPMSVLILFLVVFPIMVVGNKYRIGVMTTVGINAIIVIGLNLLMGYAGQVSLGHAGFFGIGAYCSGLLNVNLGISPWISTILAIAFTAVIAYIIGIPTLKLKGHYLAMATLGFGEVVYVVLSKLDWLTKDTSGLLGITPFSMGFIEFGSNSALGQYVFVWVVTLAVMILSLNITRSRVGRAFRAIHGSEVAASAMGVDIAKYKVQVFVLSAIYAALAGSLYAHFHGFIGYPTFHLGTSITLVTMVVIGGSGSLWGAILGAILLTWLPEWLSVIKKYDIVVYGLLLMLVMIFMPDGLAGRLSALISFIKNKFSSSKLKTENQ
jgi:branched-chain amino acid transport system permease protein